MVLPLSLVNTVQIPASKPGNITDHYIRVQDINNAINECKRELQRAVRNPFMWAVVEKSINNWLVVSK